VGPGTERWARQGRGRVLAVDDDAAILGMLSRVLSSEGFEVSAVSGAVEALDSIRADEPDVVLLDVNLVGKDGFEVLAELRQTLDIPVILLTGRGAEPDRVLGLQMGADDYVVKPFSYPELVARIDNILRRSGAKAAPVVRTFGPLKVDMTSREVRVDGVLVVTTAKEFDLLAFLAASPRQVFTRDQLLQHVWGSSAAWQDPATVTEHVRRLRIKIEEAPEQPRWILTVRGVGYRFEP
jgi:DNA-binding response OmpR family regulator